MSPSQARYKKEPIMHIAVAIVVAMILTGCRLGPQVSDQPGASAHLLPRGTLVPDIASDLELTNQIRVNDGLDDDLVATHSGAVPLGTGKSDRQDVHYWSFGVATRAPAPLFELFAKDGSGLRRLEHPALVYAIPGDPGYNPLHTIHRVVVTDDYDGELITTAEALADAIDLGLVEEPVPAHTFVNIPIVAAGTSVETGDPSKPTRTPPNETLYARGYTVAAFRFGGALGVQPVGGFLPTMQVSFLHAPGEAGYNAARPVFQATIPTAPGTDTASYSALSTVLNVNLRDPPSTAITSDEDLFLRTPPVTGDITGTTLEVLSYEVTTIHLVLQLQLPGGNP